MKTWKLVSGILSLALCLFVLMQSCAAGVVNSIEENGDSSGSAGVLVSLAMLCGGVVSIATRNKSKKGGNIALIIIYGIAALVGITSAGIFKDLYVWSAWCLVCAFFALVALVKKSKKLEIDKNSEKKVESEE